MTNSTMTVTKTLVIGLGSTGTRVCNGILRRLEWEYGSADRAPWVQFMAIETNNNEPTPLKQKGDFFPIGLDARTYGQILAEPQSYRNIALERWADMHTLRRLKDTEGGAGNIRMVGRLTFMTEPNFGRIKRALLDRLTLLRRISEHDAFQARGTMQDGSNPNIVFGSGGEIRVFVVGTLCGGTGSGLSPDFGYFLRSLPLKEEEKVVGIFTLPHENLTPTVSPMAQRLKKNAYHALLELNHYHNANAATLPPILYPDNTAANLNVEPYDLPYLIAPSAPTKLAENELNELVADRIFMNIVIPDADPFSSAVDAPLPDRDHQAHVFSTFGLSAVEFPAPQITEAASKKLLHGALTQWQMFKAERVIDLTTSLGVDWASLVTALLQQNPDEWQVEALRAVTSEMTEGKTDFSRLDRALGELRQRIAPDGALSNDLRARREQVVEVVYSRFEEHARRALLDRTYGPQVLAAEVDRLLGYLEQLHEAARQNTAVAQSAAGEAWRKVDEGVARLKAEVKRKTFLNPNRAGIERAQRDLKKAIGEFARLQVEMSIHASIQSYRTYGEIDFGIAEKLGRLFQRVQERLRKLDGRVTALRNRLYSAYEAKASELPPVNGMVLFEPRITVQQEYVRALEAGKKSSVEHLDNIEARLHEEIISHWKDLPPAVVPPLRQIDASWIEAAYDPRGDHLIPQAALQHLLAFARQPFVTFLAQENVVERLMRDRQTNPATDSKVRDAAGRAQPFLMLNKNKATQGNRSPVLERQSLLLPHTQPEDEQTYKHLVSDTFSPSNTVYMRSPDPTRALFLKEVFRFPLRGLDQVLGEGGLQAAECHDFPTFHTRRDVNWYGLSKREGQLLADAEEAVIIGVLLGELDIRDGLVLPWTMKGFGDRDFRRLPADLADAARMLARGDSDVDGYSLVGALPTLQAKIERHWNRPELPAAESSQQFVELLWQKLRDFYDQGRQGQVAGWGDQPWAGERVGMYVAKHSPLHEASMRLFPPEDALINRLTLRKGQAGKWGGVVPQDGLYCPECGGLIGRDVQEAAQNGWRCFINSSHYYGA